MNNELTKENWRNTWFSFWAETEGPKQDVLTKYENNYKDIIRQVHETWGLDNFAAWPQVEGDYFTTIPIYVAMLQWIKKDTHDIPDEEYWAMVRDAWHCYKHPEFHYSYFNKLFFAGRPGRQEYLVAPKGREKELYDSLPDTVRVYRGCWEGAMDGISYSLRQEVAMYFAFRGIGFRKQSYVITAEVKKEDIIMLLHADIEQEIVAIERNIISIDKVNDKTMQPIYNKLKVEWDNRGGNVWPESAFS
jgi:hypothetical protein